MPRSGATGPATRRHIGLDWTLTTWGEAGGYDAEVLFGTVSVAVLDESDNFLDVLGKRWLEGRINDSAMSILYVSHDRELLARTADRVVTVEGGYPRSSSASCSASIAASTSGVPAWHATVVHPVVRPVRRVPRRW